MKYFKLPDLGEGLTEAEIVSWHVKPGETVESDQALASIETDKAIVEVPSPQAGVIAAIFGEEGDLIHVGEPLVEFEGEEDEDQGTVVGRMKSADNEVQEESFIIGGAGRGRSQVAGATPAVRSLAKRLGVDLALITASGKFGQIIAEDVQRVHALNNELGASEPLTGVRRSMARNMSRSHAEVVPVSVMDDADIEDWREGQDPTLRLIRAVGFAAGREGALNAWFDSSGPSRRLLGRVNLGIAVDTGAGLFVPVLRDITNREAADLRAGLDRLREDVKNRSIPPSELSGASIALSNFGTIAGRYATPIVVPPMVAIIGAGVIRAEPAAHNGRLVLRRRLPLSLTFDHRAVTGGEAARFLAALIEDLGKEE